MLIHFMRGVIAPAFLPASASGLPARHHARNPGLHLWQVVWKILLFTLLLLLPTTALEAQEAGESVTRRGTVNEDIYLAGRTVSVDAVVHGDVLAAGGILAIGNEVTGDAMLAGGTITIRGKMHDDVRAAGGSVTLDADVGDDALLAGGNVVLMATSRVGGRAWLAGGNLEIGGHIGKELKAAGGHIVITGEVTGDATLAGEDIEIRPEAVIHGNLRYASPKEAIIDKAAKIDGNITHLPSPRHERGSARAGAHLGFLVTLTVTGIVLLWLFPRAATAVTNQIALAPWKSLGLGLAVLTATPLVIILLFASLAGVWLGFLLLASYLIALLCGFLVGALCAGEAGLKRMRRHAEITHGWRVAALVITLIVVGVLGLVPGLGGLVIFGMLLLGLGGLALQIYRTYTTA